MCVCVLYIISSSTILRKSLERYIYNNNNILKHYRHTKIIEVLRTLKIFNLQRWGLRR